MPHKNRVFVQMTFIDPAVNTVKGLAGGYHGLALNLLQARNGRLGDAIAAGRWPGHRDQLEEITGGLSRIGPREFIAPLPPGDVIVVEHNAGAGYGDPLEREPERVRDDVELERVTRAAAARHYAVIIDDSGVVDVEATEQARARIREHRLQSATLAAGRQRLGGLSGGEVVLPGAAGNVDLVRADGEARWACSSCAENLGRADQNFKLAAACLESNPHDVDELMYADPAEDADPTIVLRQYFCPGCATLLSQEMCPADAEALFDFQLHQPPPNPDS
jgi:N-methylhydantoinase B